MADLPLTRGIRKPAKCDYRSLDSERFAFGRERSRYYIPGTDI